MKWHYCMGFGKLSFSELEFCRHIKQDLQELDRSLRWSRKSGQVFCCRDRKDLGECKWHENQELGVRLGTIIMSDIRLTTSNF